MRKAALDDGRVKWLQWMKCFRAMGLVHATGGGKDEDELLGCTAPSHLPKSPIRLIRLCSRPTWKLGFLDRLLHFGVFFRLSGEKDKHLSAFFHSTLPAERPPHSFSCLSSIIRPILSSTHIFFHFTNHFLVIILLWRSLISGSFITCPSSTFSLSLFWHFCHQQANTSIPISGRKILHQINILDRRLDSPTLPSSHSFGPYRQPFVFSTIASPEQSQKNPSSTNR